MLIPEHFPNIGQQEARLERALVVFHAKERERIRAAFAFARRAHEGQFREGSLRSTSARSPTDRIPYIIHPIRVACTLVDEFGLRDADAVTAALLHDVVEDCGVDLSDIERRFGRTVQRYVAALTWWKGTDAKWRQAETIRRQPRTVRLIKASDVIDNSRAMWQVEDRARTLRLLYGYGHWGRRIVETLGAPATIFLDHALRKSTTIHFENDPEPPFKPNAGKALAVEGSKFKDQISNFARYPIRTHVIVASDDLLGIVRRYALAYLRPSDTLVVSERIVAITQGRAFPISSIRPSRWARFLMRFVTKSPYGIGLARPETMELAIREAGLPRILLAAFVAAITKPFGIRGMFYRVVGKHINAIDGPCDYTIPLVSGERYAKLGPKDPEGVAEHIAREIGVDTAIVDANDLGVNVLGVSEGVDRAFVRSALTDNPLGQSDEQTPLAIVRAANDGENPKF